MAEKFPLHKDWTRVRDLIDAGEDIMNITVRHEDFHGDTLELFTPSTEILNRNHPGFLPENTSEAPITEAANPSPNAKWKEAQADLIGRGLLREEVDGEADIRTILALDLSIDEAGIMMQHFGKLQRPDNT